MNKDKRPAWTVSRSDIHIDGEALKDAFVQELEIQMNGYLENAAEEAAILPVYGCPGVLEWRVGDELELFTKVDMDDVVLCLTGYDDCDREGWATKFEAYAKQLRSS